MAAVEQDITAEQGAALAVTLTGAGASLQGRTLRMHVRSKVGVITTKLVASTADGRLTVGADPYTTAALAIGSDVMAAVSVTLPVEYWVYDVESYTSATDVRREWYGRWTITRDVTRDTEADTEDSLAGLVRYDTPQSLTTAQAEQGWYNLNGDELARDAIGAALVAGSNVTITVSDAGDTITIAASGGGGGGSGDVVGPAGATDDRIAAFDGVTGKLIKQGGVTATAVASHLSSTSNPHSVTAAQVGADPTGTAAAAVVAHTGATDPHGDRSFATSAVSTHAALTTGAHGITAAGAALLDDADAAAQRTTLGLGTAATQAISAFEASGAIATHNAVTTAHGISAYGATLVDDADAATARSTLGLGTAATTAATDYATASHNHSGVYQPLATVLTNTTAAFTAAQETKLSGIETAADVTDAGNVGAAIDGATAKTTPVDADTVPLIDSAASNALKKLSWANLKATAKTYFDTLYAAVGRTVSAAGLATGGGDLSANRTITVTASTAANVSTGTATDSALTPGAYKDSTPFYVDRAADWTLALTDRNKDQWFNNGASALVCTIPLNSSVAFAVGDTIPFVRLASGTATIDAATSVTLNGVSGGSCTISTRYQGALLKKIATDSWVVSGDVSAVA